MLSPSSWPYKERRRKLQDVVNADESSLIVITGKGNITYLTGIREPSGLLVISDKCGDTIISSILDYHRLQQLAPPELDVVALGRKGEEGIKTNIVPKLFSGETSSYIKSLVETCNIKQIYSDISIQTIESHNRIFKNINIKTDDITKHIYKIRSIKDSWELERIAEAVNIAEEALRRAINSLDDKSSEASIAGIIHLTMLERGAWSEAFPSIVAFHENTAFPHHTPTLRQLGEGGPVLIDLGAVYQGYHSDMTRTFWRGQPSTDFKRNLEAVIEAQNAALDVIEPGIEASQADRAARAVLEKMGLSHYFIHGLGHGVGVEIHEPPFLRPGSKEVLNEGMVVTIEPGIYMPGLYGIRVEDMIVVTQRGSRILTKFSRIIDI